MNVRVFFRFSLAAPIVLASLILPTVRSEETPEPLDRVSYYQPTRGTNDSPPADSLPPYDYTIQNGLYATVTALSNLEQPQFKNDEKQKLKGIPGCEKEMEVRVMWQGKPAPLAVVLLGLGSRGNSPMARTFQSYLHEAGFHVLTFDSPFLPAFSERSRHGVAGNVAAEAALVAGMLETFLKSSKAKGMVTRVGLVGVSYGGVLALNIAKLSAAGKTALKPTGVLALSPPVSLKTAAALLDKYYADERWNYTLAELYGAMANHKPVPDGQPVPFTDGQMRAGLAAAFRQDLKDVVNHNDQRYKLNLLPKAGLHDDQYRRDWAETWTFTKFIEEMTFTYWSKKGGVAHLNQLWEFGDLAQVVPHCPDYVKLVIAANDPMNDPEELAKLKSDTKPGRLTVLPHGGHMGYLGSKWCKARVQKLFE